VSVATVAASAITEHRQGDTIRITFSGRFGCEIDQWAYLPFEVPAGVQRIRVSTSHDRFAVGGPIRNVLDLGIFGPDGHDVGNAAGFRGWSGGVRDGFVISGSHATPGYLAGPIEPGVWAVALGPVVLSPWGMTWQAHVILERGQPALEERVSGPAFAYSAPPVRRAGWYRGDLHLHTVHSDGQRYPDELVTAAHASGLDFIVSTDHNTNSANRVWPACRTGALLVIPGEEVTTRHDHWLAVGLPPDAWVDWRYAPRDGVPPKFAKPAPWWSPLIPPRRCQGRCGSSVLTMWRRSRYGTAGGTSMMKCRFAFGGGYCVKANASLRSVAAIPMLITSRSVRRRRSCTCVNCRYLRSSTGCAAAARTSPGHVPSQWNSPCPRDVPPNSPAPGRRCGCVPGHPSRSPP
jgi:hypothetical protein